MAEHEPQGEAGREAGAEAEDGGTIPEIALPPRQSLPPPPEVTYTRPSLGHAAPAQTPNSQKLGFGKGDAQTPMDNAARMGAGLSAGITLAASVIVGFFIGQWIDHRFNHSAVPWGTLVMSLAGIAAGFLNLFRIVGGGPDKPRKPK